MLSRIRKEHGIGMVEMIIAMVVITIALLALAAAYDQAFFSLHSSARKSAAANLAEQQLETYGSIGYTNIALDATTRTAVRAADTQYVSDEASLTPTGTAVTSSCGTSSAWCLPVQCTPAATCTYPVTTSEDPVGSDGRHYKVETFIRDVTQSLSCTTTTSCGTTTERVVTVIVRDPNQTGTPLVYEASVAFDQGPR